MRKTAHQIWKECQEQNLSDSEYKAKLLQEGIIVKKHHGKYPLLVRLEKLGDNNGYYPIYNKNAIKANFLQFIINTCYNPNSQSPFLLENIEVLWNNLANKITGIGYLLHSIYPESDLDNKKIVVATDSENESQGRSGKSLLANFILERTKQNVIHYDDINLNFNPEKDLYNSDRRIYLSLTNHCFKNNKYLNNESFKAKIFIIPFSNYYNENRKPENDFEYPLLDKQNSIQNNFDNQFAKCCIQAYLEHGLIEVNNYENIL